MEDFVHHILFTSNGAEFLNSIDKVTVRDEASFFRHAVSASDFRRASKSVCPSSSLVSRAGFISDRIVVDVLVSSQAITTITTQIRSLTGDQDLWGEIDIRPLSISSDLDTIRKSRG